MAGNKRIAILPFANIGPDPQDEYLADGMTEELGHIAVERGRFQEALGLVDKIASIFPPMQPHTRVLSAYILARSGSIAKAKQLFEASETRPGEGYVTYIDYASYYAAVERPIEHSIC